ncbi:hypothetical protein BASA81_013618 [Batrachochytrium salamandrivorans]|nr:hypothetical protein BASA81_013618 [Batrachochytrium salamandrivorans]
MDSSAIIPESRLRQNPGLEQWINEHVSKNPRNIRIRPLSTPEPIGPEGQKLAQGPFLPKYRLIQKIQKPLHPTLRVETGFFDTPTFLREEQRHHLRLCVSQKPFTTGKVPDIPAMCYRSRNEPFIVKNDGTSYKNINLDKRMSKKVPDYFEPFQLERFNIYVLMYQETWVSLQDDLCHLGWDSLWLSTSAVEETALSLPPVTPSQSTTLLPQVEQDEVLQGHYVRVQKTLMDSVDRRALEIESELRENQIVLKRAMEDKISVGEALYKVNSEVTKLNSTLASTRNALNNTHNEYKIVSKLHSASGAEVQDLLRTNQALQQGLENTRHQLDEACTKINHLQQINTGYTSNTKIQRRIQNKLKKELEISEMKRKQVGDAVEADKKLLEMGAQKRQELLGLVDLQKSEVIVAQNAIDTMHKEINELKSKNEATEKQWSEAISAMSNRDKVFHAMEESKAVLSTEKLEAQNVCRVLRLERDEAIKNLSEKEIECQDVSKKLQDLRLLHKYTLKQYDTTHSDLKHAENAEAIYKVEFNQLKKSDELKSMEIDKKNAEMSGLKSRLSRLKSDFEQQMKIHVPVEKAIHREVLIKQQATNEIKCIEREEESKNIDLRRQNALLKMKINDLSEKNVCIAQERDLVKEKYSEISTHYSKLYEEANHLMYTLERREYDLNLIRAKMNQKEVDRTGTSNIIIGRLEKNLADAIKERDRLQKLWLESHKDSLKEKANVTHLEQEKLFIQTKLGINDAVKVKMNLELDNSKNETFEQKMESAKLYNELRRLKPMLDDLQKKNKTLEQQLSEAHLEIEKAHVNKTTSTHMLRTEIRRLYQDKKDLRKSRTENIQISMNVERNTEVLKEMVEKLKSERYELQRTNYVLKRKAEEMERKYFDAKLQARKITERQQLSQSKTSNAAQQQHQKLSQSIPLLMGGSLNSLVSASNPSLLGLNSAPAEIPEQSTGKDRLNNETLDSFSLNREVKHLPDFEAWRLKIDSLVKEKVYHINENKKLKDEILMYMECISKGEQLLRDERLKHSMVKAQRQELDDSVRNLNRRCQRAEKIAAHMEQQIKDAKPNLKIDYQMLGEPEPSTQLLAALMAWENMGHTVEKPMKLEEPGIQSLISGAALRRASGLRM